MKINKSYVRTQTLNKTIDEKDTNVTALLANKVDKVTGKDLTKNELTDTLKTQYDEAYQKIGLLQVREALNLMPQEAHVIVPYGTAQSFTITAVDASSAGNGIQIVFEDPAASLNQVLDVTVVDGVIIIDHATDGAGAITTTAGNLLTAINNHIDAGALVQCTMGSADTIDHIGTVETAGWVTGIVCKSGHMFTDGTDLVISLEDTDGVDNQLANFKKVTLSSI